MLGLGKAPGEEAHSLLYLPQHNGGRVRPFHDIRENFVQQFKEEFMFDGYISIIEWVYDCHWKIMSCNEVKKMT